MQIEPVNNNLYDDRGMYVKRARQRVLRRKRSVHAPIDAVTFELSSNDRKKVELDQNQSMLKAYIDALPDDEVNRRIRKFKSSFNFIEDAMVEKLLMEEL